MVPIWCVETDLLNRMMPTLKRLRKKWVQLGRAFLPFVQEGQLAIHPAEEDQKPFSKLNCLRFKDIRAQFLTADSVSGTINLKQVKCCCFFPIPKQDGQGYRLPVVSIFGPNCPISAAENKTTSKSTGAVSQSTRLLKSVIFTTMNVFTSIHHFYHVFLLDVLTSKKRIVHFSWIVFKEQLHRNRHNTFHWAITSIHDPLPVVCERPKQNETIWS